LPLVFYAIMALSLIWTRDIKLSMSGLQKELPFVFIPLAFACIPGLSRFDIYKSFRWFSFGMVLFALYYLANAAVRYADSGDMSVFSIMNWLPKTSMLFMFRFLLRLPYFISYR